MRLLYSLTNGLSNILLSIPFRMIYKNKKSQLALVDNIKKFGYVRISSNEESIRLVKKISENSITLPVYEATPNQTKKKYSSFQEIIKDGIYQVPRYNHFDLNIISMPEVWQLINEMKLHSIASSYLGCEAIITSLSSWYVVPISKSNYSEQLYSYTAQSYHYDMDWISFLKIFINLDDVNTMQGPFEYLPHTHRGRAGKYYKDKRFQDLDNKSSPVFATGEVGSIFIADTSGLHRDGRAISNYRQVLTIEFAISAFGAKIQIDPTLDAWKSKPSNIDIIPPQLFSSRASKLYR
ncbi:hypothetical protein [Prochlorococcus sp. MIT 1307]|uniref:hypothetical protein n=1 Tax=Prochlorococcus sp. MIT 1307 TaxID=3096219 RepID=UPI002A753980|nr:hypothetical protein [Prochlorococcus sp. MIT 1307]